jgi:hypothetical protein
MDDESKEMRTEPKLRQIFGDMDLPEVFVLWVS